MKLSSAYLIVLLAALFGALLPAPAHATQDEYRQGVLFYVERQYDDALRSFRSYLKDHPQSESARQWITIIESSQPRLAGSPQFQLESGAAAPSRTPLQAVQQPVRPKSEPVVEAPAPAAASAAPVRDDTEERRLRGESARLREELEAQEKQWERERIDSSLKTQELNESLQEARRGLKVSEAQRHNLEKRVQDLEAPQGPGPEAEKLKSETEHLSRQLEDARRRLSEADGGRRDAEGQLSALQDKARALTGELDSSRSRIALAEDKTRRLALRLQEQMKAGEEMAARLKSAEGAAKAAQAPRPAAAPPAPRPDPIVAQELGRAREDARRLRAELDKLRAGMTANAENTKAAQSADGLEKRLADALAEKETLESAVRDLHVILDRVNHELRQHQLAIRDFRQKQDTQKPDCPE